MKAEEEEAIEFNEADVRAVDEEEITRDCGGRAAYFAELEVCRCEEVFNLVELRAEGELELLK